MKRALGALVVIGLIGSAVWLGLRSGGEVTINNKRGSVFVGESEDADTPSPRCDEDIPFEPTYLPEGFTHDLFEGRFPGGRPLDDQSPIGGRPHEQQVVVHYRGSDGRAIEIRRPGTLFVELAQRSDAPTIYVLGTETAGFAPLEPGGDEFIVTFPYPHVAKPHQWCSRYSLNEYGDLSLAELKKVATDLRVRAKDNPFKLMIHCGLSYPLRFKGRNWLPVDRNLRRSHNPPEGFGGDENYDIGTMRVVDDDTIIYTSSEGIGVQYEPTERKAEGCE